MIHDGVSPDNQWGHWARYVGANPWRTGLTIVGLCVTLVAISIALGG